MNDMRILASLIISALTMLGLLLAKAFAFSVAYVLWPAGILAVVIGLLIILLSGWSA